MVKIKRALYICDNCGYKQLSYFVEAEVLSGVVSRKCLKCCVDCYSRQCWDCDSYRHELVDMKTIEYTAEVATADRDTVFDVVAKPIKKKGLDCFL